MQKKRARKLFTIIKVTKHKAEKTYLCPDGVILPGQLYWRGFAVCNEIEPFEFFFTNKLFIETKTVPNSYLRDSVLRYREGKHKVLC